MISDCDEMPLANADVILYRVGTDKSLVPVAIQEQITRNLSVY